MERDQVERTLKSLYGVFSSIPEVCKEWEHEDQVDFGLEAGYDLMNLDRLFEAEKNGLLTHNQTERLHEIHRMLVEYRPYLQELCLRYEREV